MSTSKELKYMCYLPCQISIRCSKYGWKVKVNVNMQSNSEVMVDELEKNLLGIKFVFPVISIHVFFVTPLAHCTEVRSNQNIVDGNTEQDKK